MPLAPSWEYDSESFAQTEADRLSSLEPSGSHPAPRDPIAVDIQFIAETGEGPGLQLMKR